MLKTAATKLAWVGKTASMVFGLALVMALSSCGGGSQQTNTPTNSTPSIAFMKEDSDGIWQTWVANKDLSNQVKLTNESADSGWAVWKPGGAKLAFESNRADPDPDDTNAINDIFTMNPDGSGIVKLTHSDDVSDTAEWSPDGEQIAFGSDRRNVAWSREIYVMDADGTSVRRVSTLPEKAEVDTAPRFSPDGRRLVFTRYISEEDIPIRAALFTVGVEGGGLKQLTPWGNGHQTAKRSSLRPLPMLRPMATFLRSTPTTASTSPTSPTTSAAVAARPTPYGRQTERRSCSFRSTTSAASPASAWRR
jgi:Tol biopolymer transport system component